MIIIIILITIIFSEEMNYLIHLLLRLQIVRIFASYNSSGTLYVVLYCTVLLLLLLFAFLYRYQQQDLGIIAVAPAAYTIIIVIHSHTRI